MKDKDERNTDVQNTDELNGRRDDGLQCQLVKNPYWPWSIGSTSDFMHELEVVGVSNKRTMLKWSLPVTLKKEAKIRSNGRRRGKWIEAAGLDATTIES